tara:strand:- start:2296 stop:2454 length:159 start_codon:yes stop_codon:yes gene_type:complete
VYVFAYGISKSNCLEENYVLYILKGFYIENKIMGFDMFPFFTYLDTITNQLK